ncbi:CDP-diacylglycerol--glycerol-3-phosphate 3-phosphatidyltransferase [bacterium]|nr:CDP-diacylglycerol--glycerol-3-phosphate 3-phosphatidyltransferase [bacterium]MBU1752998.1 CDP-diacylglycerol--glycerol-3-phosphate 3-phosphatidyltransferase [bacterium]
MNLANKLTLARVVMVPVFVGFLFLNNPFGYCCSLLIFILAAITDWYDGKIARDKNMVSTLGKFADPLADKMLVSAAFISFVGIPVLHIPAWVVIFIICREFAVTGLRLMAVSEGVVIHASGGGKVKTVLQMGTIITILLLLCLRGYMGYMPIWLRTGMEWLPLFLMLIVVGITTITGIEYLMKHRGILR